MRLLIAIAALVAPLTAIHGGNNMRYSWHIMAPIKVCNGGYYDRVSEITHPYPATHLATKEHRKSGKLDQCGRCGATWITYNSLLTAAHCFAVKRKYSFTKRLHKVDHNAAVSVFLLKDEISSNWNSDRSKYNNYQPIDTDDPMGWILEDMEDWNSIISTNPKFSYDATSTSVGSRVTYVVHPDFWVGHDIAIINIDKAQPNGMSSSQKHLHRIEPVELPTLCDYNTLYDYEKNYGQSKYGSKKWPYVTSFGFGDTGSKQATEVREMRKVSIELKKPIECTGLRVIHDKLVSYNTLCAKSHYGRGDDYRGICQGDSGGPGIVKALPGRDSMLFGISSQGRPGCPPHSVYGSWMQFTSVAHYREWIEENIADSPYQIPPYNEHSDCMAVHAKPDKLWDNIVKLGGNSLDLSFRWIDDKAGGFYEVVDGWNVRGDALLDKLNSKLDDIYTNADNYVNELGHNANKIKDSFMDHIPDTHDVAGGIVNTGDALIDGGKNLYEGGQNLLNDGINGGGNLLNDGINAGGNLLNDGYNAGGNLVGDGLNYVGGLFGR